MDKMLKNDYNFFFNSKKDYNKKYKINKAKSNKI